MTDDLGQRFPDDTVTQFNFLPALQGQLALSRDDAPAAIEALQVAAPYELGNADYVRLYPVYVRGEAYLAAHQGSEAAAEFQKILDHRGIVLNEPIGALAHLQLGRAYAMQGDTAKATRRVSRFPHALERRRPRHPHPNRRQSRACQIELNGTLHKANTYLPG